MAGDYRKYSVEMKGGEVGYRLWKRGRQSVVCVFETYKEKRAVYFSVSNLLPSSVLLREEGREYHLILLGSSDGEIIHMDFGVFSVNPRGEGLLRRKFTGLPLSCYTHCLLAALDRETGAAETVFEGAMPFFYGAEPGAPEKERKQIIGKAAEEAGKAGEPGSAYNPETVQKKTEALQESEDFLFRRTWGSIFEKYHKKPFSEIFAKEWDETGSLWSRVSGDEKLPAPLSPYKEWIKKYEHYIIGKGNHRYFAGIPGRFLQCEQPSGEGGRFSLWQPIRGGECFFSDLSELTGTLQEEIYGYWICGIDEKSGEIRVV